MKNIIFKGCGTAIITPFTEDNKVDFDAFKKMLEFQLNEGADCIIVCGTTGEASTMSLEERKETIKFALDTVNKKIPIIAGTGSNNTQSAIEMTQYCESIGVNGALVVTPYYNKTTQAGLVAHYSAIANSTKLPIVLYNVPGRTGVNITPKTCLELSKIENIIAIKEASGNLSQIAEIANLCGDELKIYSGNDDQIIPILSVGGIGVISVLSNIMPKYTHQMTEEFFSGNVEIAAKMQVDAIPLIKALFCEVNPIPVKAACNLMKLGGGNPRLPLIPISSDGLTLLETEMKKMNLL